MSTTTTPTTGAGRGRYASDGDPDRLFDAWTERSRIVLQPIAAPSILGLFGFAGATFIVAAHLAGWYGNTSSALYLFPFAALFGGLAQFMAGMFSFRARDALATAMHGMWGSFWMAYGLLYLLFANGSIAEPAGTDFPELGFWFIVLGAITAVGALAALGENIGLSSVLIALAAGSGSAAAAYLADSSTWEKVAGYCFVVSAGLAFYVASAMLLESTYGRVILPLGKYSGSANVPGGSVTRPVEYPYGMPGVRKGQ